MVGENNKTATYYGRVAQIQASAQRRSLLERVVCLAAKDASSNGDKGQRHTHLE